jgi:K(+)-stimulated pyrophosphate-energized sodium pump
MPLLWVGYGFGASFIALVTQLGVDIYKKIANICANLVERLEKDNLENNPMKLILIANLVSLQFTN